MTRPDRPIVLTRRRLLGAALAAGAGLGLADSGRAFAAPKRLPAPARGSATRLSIPGKIVKVRKSGTLQPNGLWPEQPAARVMLERAMSELTGKNDLGQAFAQFVGKDDRVAVKPNGLGGRNTAGMATNKELVIEITRGLVAAGVPASSIVIYDQYDSFLKGCRIVDQDMKLDPAFPAGVTAVFHDNRDAVMEPITVSGQTTRFVRALTEATAVINVPVIKDHGICGYTGALKNMTHGSIVNPQKFHDHRITPQIAELYAHEIVRSRVVLHVVDGFKAMYDGGPSDRKPSCRVPHETVYVSTDPVALDVLGWQVVDGLRRDHGLPALAAAGREPSYIRLAGELGLGVFDQNQIRVRDVVL
jgi:uncharacterized protein (DUF362 family)